MSDLPPDEPDPKRLAALEKKLAAVRKAQEPPPRRVDHHLSQANMAWRMVVEMVSGLGIGFGIGLGLDALFGTMPIFMVLFTMLGFAAGVKVMLRSAKEMNEDRAAEQAETLSVADEEDDRRD
ncbi:AtpZ/AtpI family protein [Thioclava indica]|nr:AtpZ/AtpI family protein [Thioclava indica]